MFGEISPKIKNPYVPGNITAGNILFGLSNGSATQSNNLSFNNVTNILSTTGINLSGLTTNNAVVTDGSKNLASLAYTSSNTVSTIVSRDSSGNFSAGTITATLSGNASTATSATTATTSTNANNVGTTLVTTNASYFPLMVSSSSNSYQAADLASGWTFNPNTNTLNTSVIQASSSLQVGTTTNSAPITVQGNGGTTGPTALLAAFTSPASPTAGNLFLIEINKSTVDALLLGVNKNTVTGQVPASTCFISTYVNGDGLSIGRGASNGLPNTTDILIDGSGNVTIPNGKLGLKTGTNGCRGSVTLSGSSTTINTTSATTGSYIGISNTSAAGTTPAGSYTISISNGVSFTINNGALDTSTVQWFIMS
jgi:hypothetical protein